MVEGYAELKEVRSTSKFGLRVLIGLADLGRAIRVLPPKEHEVVLLHGLLGLRADELLGVDRVTIWRRYSAGIERITNFLNGS